MRKRIFEIIEKSKPNDIISKTYDIFMIIIIFLSLVPITVKEQTSLLITIDYACAYIFIIDYILRWITSDYKLNQKLSLKIQELHTV